MEVTNGESLKVSRLSELSTHNAGHKTTVVLESTDPSFRYSDLDPLSLGHCGWSPIGRQINSGHGSAGWASRGARNKENGTRSRSSGDSENPPTFAIV
jgi:hypothetical protein